MRRPRIASLALFSLAANALPTVAGGGPEPIAVIPFKRDGKLIMVETRINGSRPQWFILDSGASHSVLAPNLAKALRLTLTPDKPTTGTGKGTVPVLRSEGVKMQLAGLVFDIPAPWVIDLSNVPIPSETAGLIGSELFKRFVVRMDQDARTLTVFDPATYRDDSRTASIPLLVEGDKLFLEATLTVTQDKIVTRKLRIDTGSESSVNDEIVRESPERRQSTLGGGLGENFQGYSGWLAAVKIGPFEFKNVWASGAPTPTIGMEMLRRFVVTFDAPHGRLYLEPTAALNEPVPPPPG